MEQANLFQSFPDYWHDSMNVLYTPPQSNSLSFEDYKPLRATSSSFERNGEFDINNHPSPPDTDDWVSSAAFLSPLMSPHHLEIHGQTKSHIDSVKRQVA